MKKFRRENMSNIREMIQNETGVNFAGGNGFRMRHYVVLAACMVCILSLSAFAFYKFNSLNGDDLALSSVYLGDGKYEVIVTNLSEHDLRLQDKVRFMGWTTGEIAADKDGEIHVEAHNIPAGGTGVVKIDISDAYDIDRLESGLSENGGYYFVLTNNHFVFGQDWMCFINFDKKDEEEALDAHLAGVESRNEDNPEPPEYQNGMMAFEDWESPVKDMKVSGYFGEQDNGTMSDHINIVGSEGEEIYAVSDGTIVDTGFKSTCGNYVVIAVDEQTTVKYGYLQSVAVSVGDRVCKKDVIGYMGKSGMATGVNLFLAVNVNGQYINPLK